MSEELGFALSKEKVKIKFKFEQVPNYLTLLRVAVIPPFVLCLQIQRSVFIWLALVLFLLAAISDWLDGYIARRWGVVSDFGKLLDPIADKILVMAALVMMAGMRSEVNNLPWVPSWMVVLLLARETWVTGLRAYAAAKGAVIPAGGAGKWKSALQMVAIILLILHERLVTIPFTGMQTTCQIIGLDFLYFSIILSYWSGYDYSKEVGRIFIAESGKNNESD